MLVAALGQSQRTTVYVDGFNRYCRAVKGTPDKWRDQGALCRAILRPTNDIRRIRYFTANVSGKPDPDAPLRQQAYLRALKTVPEVTLHHGRFLVTEKWAALAVPPPMFIRPNPVTVYVVKTGWKRSREFREPHEEDGESSGSMTRPPNRSPDAAFASHGGNASPPNRREPCAVGGGDGERDGGGVQEVRPIALGQRSGNSAAIRRLASLTRGWNSASASRQRSVNLP